MKCISNVQGALIIVTVERAGLLTGVNFSYGYLRTGQALWCSLHSTLRRMRWDYHHCLVGPDDGRAQAAISSPGQARACRKGVGFFFPRPTRCLTRSIQVASTGQCRANSGQSPESHHVEINCLQFTSTQRVRSMQNQGARRQNWQLGHYVPKLVGWLQIPAHLSIIQASVEANSKHNKRG